VGQHAHQFCLLDGWVVNAAQICGGWVLNKCQLIAGANVK
jgi:hypothetical protein